jgi:formiminoglutamase
VPRPPTPATPGDDPRVGHLLGAALQDADVAPTAVLIGFPSDEGVRRNGGRPGAAQGPAAIRQALARLTPDAEAPERFVRLLAHTRDLGDVAVSGDVEGDQAALASTLAPHLAAGAFAIVLGGGHETAYGHFQAHAALGQPVRILNWDAHADVRELRDGRAHSGSPFRQALEHESGLCQRYVVAGLQPHSAAGAHLAYVCAHGAAPFRHALDDPALMDALYAENPTLVSFDVDAVDRAHAPGVSAPATDGLPVALWLRAAYQAGRTPTVRGADVVELSPPLDGDGRTAALAALTVWQLLRGLAARTV